MLLQKLPHSVALAAEHVMLHTNISITGVVVDAQSSFVSLMDKTFTNTK